MGLRATQMVLLLSTEPLPIEPKSGKPWPVRLSAGMDVQQLRNYFSLLFLFLFLFFLCVCGGDTASSSQFLCFLYSNFETADSLLANRHDGPRTSPPTGQRQAGSGGPTGGSGRGSSQTAFRQ